MEIGPYGVPGYTTYVWKYMKLEYLKDSIARDYFWFSTIEALRELDYFEGQETAGTLNYHATGILADQVRYDEPCISIAIGQTEKQRETRKKKVSKDGALCLFENTTESNLMWIGYGGEPSSLDYVAVRFDINSLILAFKGLEGLVISKVKYVDHHEVLPYNTYEFEKNRRFVNELEVRIRLCSDIAKELVSVIEMDRGFEVPFDWKSMSRKLSHMIRVFPPAIQPPTWKKEDYLKYGGIELLKHQYKEYIDGHQAKFGESGEFRGLLGTDDAIAYVLNGTYEDSKKNDFYS